MTARARVSGGRTRWAGLLAFAALGACATKPGGSASDGATPRSLAELGVPKLAPARSASATSSAEPSPEDALKSAGEMVTRAQAALRDLQRIARQATVPPGLEALAQVLPERRAELQTRVNAAKDAIRRSRRAAWVRDIRYAFVEDDLQIQAWQAQVNESSSAVTAGRARITELLGFWRRADELARQANVPAEVREQTARVVEEGTHTELLLAGPEAVTIRLELTLAEMRDMTDGFLHFVDHEGPNLVADARERDFSVLGTVRGLLTLRDPLATVRETSRHMGEMARLFVTNSAEELLGHAVFFVVLLLSTLSLRSHADEWVGNERQGRIARRVIKRPFAATLLLGMVAGIAIYPTIPSLILIVAYVLAMSAALRLFPTLLDPRLLQIGYALCAFVLVDVLRLFVIEIAPLDRLLLTLELAAAAGVLSYVLFTRRWQASLFAERSPRFYRAVAWAWLIGAGIGTLAALFGYGSLAEILGGGVLVSMYLALIVAAAFGAAEGTLWVLTQDGLFGRSNAVRKHRSRLVQTTSGLLRWAALLLWAQLSLEYLTLWEATRRVFFGILNASLEVGSLKISLGHVAVLGVGAVLAVYLARSTRFLLEEDVMSRLTLSESTRQASSLTAYYAVLLLGFFFALAAAGIELDRLTVLAGAFGVGIGFGLQNVVQNFVAGLLLLFGGPIKIGDKIQIGDLTGEVRSIGFRASTVRTYQGAEVIVPNSKLIADQVVNWTMSDQKRRGDIDIGVDYGSDPERVLALLLEVARAHPKVLAEPAPGAVFVRHGANSLDFQLLVWSTFDDSGSVKSELTTAINQRLVREKIGMPFPQRDLNLKSVPADLLEALRTNATK
jgi:small-conductance mechanosensitive channel